MISEDNFDEHFFRASANYKPTKGQVLARWRAIGEFVDSAIKRQVIGLLLKNKAGAETARQIMQKIVSVADKDAVKVLLQMSEDLYRGASEEEVAQKPYKMLIQQFYWTNKELVPDDPHWDIISIYDVSGILSKEELQQPEPSDIVYSLESSLKSLLDK